MMTTVKASRGATTTHEASRRSKGTTTTTTTYATTTAAATVASQTGGGGSSAKKLDSSASPYCGSSSVDATGVPTWTGNPYATAAWVGLYPPEDPSTIRKRQRRQTASNWLGRIMFGAATSPSISSANHKYAPNAIKPVKGGGAGPPSTTSYQGTMPYPTQPHFAQHQQPPPQQQQQQQQQYLTPPLPNQHASIYGPPPFPLPHPHPTAAAPRENPHIHPFVRVPPNAFGPIRDYHVNDVLCGRGGRINAHSGNVQFRKMVQQKKAEYLSPHTKKLAKAAIAAAIVETIRQFNPPGRFLKEEPDGTWYEIGDYRAIKKVGQALREDTSPTTTTTSATTNVKTQQAGVVTASTLMDQERCSGSGQNNSDVDETISPSQEQQHRKLPEDTDMFQGENDEMVISQFKDKAVSAPVGIIDNTSYGVQENGAAQLLQCYLSPTDMTSSSCSSPKDVILTNADLAAAPTVPTTTTVTSITSTASTETATNLAPPNERRVPAATTLFVPTLGTGSCDGGGHSLERITSSTGTTSPTTESSQGNGLKRSVAVSGRGAKIITTTSRNNQGATTQIHDFSMGSHRNGEMGYGNNHQQLLHHHSTIDMYQQQQPQAEEQLNPFHSWSNFSDGVNAPMISGVSATTAAIVYGQNTRNYRQVQPGHNGVPQSYQCDVSVSSSIRDEVPNRVTTRTAPSSSPHNYCPDQAFGRTFHPACPTKARIELGDGAQHNSRRFPSAPPQLLQQQQRQSERQPTQEQRKSQQQQQHYCSQDDSILDVESTISGPKEFSLLSDLTNNSADFMPIGTNTIAPAVNAQQRSSNQLRQLRELWLQHHQLEQPSQPPLTTDMLTSTVDTATFFGNETLPTSSIGDDLNRSELDASISDLPRGNDSHDRMDSIDGSSFMDPTNDDYTPLPMGNVRRSSALHQHRRSLSGQSSLFSNSSMARASMAYHYHNYQHSVSWPQSHQQQQQIVATGCSMEDVTVTNMSLASNSESLPSMPGSIMSDLSETLMALDLAEPTTYFLR